MTSPRTRVAPDRCCLACGYRLAGLPAGGCPECGRRFDPADPLTVAAPRDRWLRPRTAIDRRRACIDCRHVLVETGSSKCPECGRAFHPERFETSLGPGSTAADVKRVREDAITLSWICVLLTFFAFGTGLIGLGFVFGIGVVDRLMRVRNPFAPRGTRLRLVLVPTLLHLLLVAAVPASIAATMWLTGLAGLGIVHVMVIGPLVGGVLVVALGALLAAGTTIALLRAVGTHPQRTRIEARRNAVMFAVWIGIGGLVPTAFYMSGLFVFNHVPGFALLIVIPIGLVGLGWMTVLPGLLAGNLAEAIRTTPDVAIRAELTT